MAVGIYDPVKRKYNKDDFYCGKNLNQLAIALKRLKDGNMTLQQAYDEIVNSIIIDHVIKNSQCECRDYLHKIEDKIKRQ